MCVGVGLSDAGGQAGCYFRDGNHFILHLLGDFAAAQLSVVANRLRRDRHLAHFFVVFCRIYSRR